MMKILFTVTLFIYYTTSLLFAQSELKQIIYADLLAINDLYNGCIIQYKQDKWVILENDTIKQLNTIATLKDSSESRVSIIKIDSINQFYFVDVRFDLIAQAPYNNLFSANIFNYVLYKENNYYFNIDGFLVSEILYTTTPTHLLKSSAKISAPNKFGRYIEERNVAKIQKYLSVSVLERIKSMGFHISDKPFVKDQICH